jgi:hypothetical protein
MTFAAMAAWQGWLLLFGAVALAAWLFLLKLRPPRVLVSSLLLWRRVLDESRELTLWERIRRAVSLALTVLIALALALAVTRPSRPHGVTAASRGRLLIVIDSSWSMLARTRGGETRWDRATAEARRLAAAADVEVALATTADGLVEGPTTDRALIDTTLDRLAPAGAEATSWPRFGDGDEVHFITDGTIARPLDAEVVVHSVFEPAANVAITAFDVRPSLAGRNAGDAYLEVANFAPAGQRVHVTLTRGTSSVFDRSFDMAPGEALRQIIPLTRGPDSALRAHVAAGDNALEIDDDAFAWIERATPLPVTVVGSQTDWLRTLLERDPDVQATFVDPSAYHPGPDDRGSSNGVLIFDRWAPPDPPERPALYFAPPADTPWLAHSTDASGTARSGPASGPTDKPEASGAAAEERRPRWEVAGSHPVVRSVDPLTLSIEKARAYSLATLVPVARSARGTPLVYVRESSASEPRDPRLVLVTFSAGESSLASAPAFPVLVGDALGWLAHPPSGGARHPGMMAFEDGIEKVIGPGGEPVPLVRVNGAALGVLRAPGLYVAEGGGARRTIAVNAGDPQVSNVWRTSANAGARAIVVTAGASGLPWWQYCAVAAFALALMEWWTWQRRITV